MQFIESGFDGVRIGIVRLRSQDARCLVTLLPLIDEDAKAYVEAILRDLEWQDAILFDASGHAPTGAMALGNGPPCLDLATQRAVLHHRSREANETGPVESNAREFGEWWEGFPVGGGPHTSVALYRSVVMAMSRRPHRIRSQFNEQEQARLREVVLKSIDKSVAGTLDRLLEAIKARALYVAILLEPHQLEEVASRLRERHDFRIVERNWLTVPGRKPGPGQARNTSATRLIVRLSNRRRRTEALEGARRAFWLSLLIVTVVGFIALTYFGIAHWSDYVSGYQIYSR